MPCEAIQPPELERLHLEPLRRAGVGGVRRVRCVPVRAAVGRGDGRGAGRAAARALLALFLFAALAAAAERWVFVQRDAETPERNE